MGFVCLSQIINGQTIILTALIQASKNGWELLMWGLTKIWWESGVEFSKFKLSIPQQSGLTTEHSQKFVITHFSTHPPTNNECLQQ